MTQSTRQDPVKIDSGHYKVEFETEEVRVLRIRYGAGERSPMHWHPESIAVFLTDANTRFHLADGSSQDMGGQVGEVMAIPAGDHSPENLNNQPFELILVELKKG